MAKMRFSFLAFGGPSTAPRGFSLPAALLHRCQCKGRRRAEGHDLLPRSVGLYAPVWSGNVQGAWDGLFDVCKINLSGLHQSNTGFLARFYTIETHRSFQAVTHGRIQLEDVLASLTRLLLCQRHSSLRCQP